MIFQMEVLITAGSNYFQGQDIFFHESLINHYQNVFVGLITASKSLEI